MNEKQLIDFVKMKALAKEGERFTVLDVGMGTGRFGRIFAEQIGQQYICVDGVEKWSGSYIHAQELFYDHVWSGDIRDLFRKIPNYDLVILDGLCHYLPAAEFIAVCDRLRHLGDILVIQGLHNHQDRNLYEPIAKQADWNRLGECGWENIDNAWFASKKNTPASALIIRTFNRYFMTVASIESLLDSWLPPSYLVFIDDCSDDKRVRSYLEQLETGPHLKILEMPEQKFEHHYLTAQRGIDICLGLDPKPDFIGFCDSDFIYNPRWYQMGVGRFEYARDMTDLKPSAWTSFHLGANSPWHKYHETLETPWGRACLRKSSGWGNILVDYEVAAGIPRTDEKEDASYADQLVRDDRFIIGTIPSYVQHVGACYSVMGHKSGDWAPDFIVS